MVRTDRKIGRTTLKCPEIGPGYARTLPVQGPHGEPSYGGKIGAQVRREQECKEYMSCPSGVYVRQDHESKLGNPLSHSVCGAPLSSTYQKAH